MQLVLEGHCIEIRPQSPHWCDSKEKSCCKRAHSKWSDVTARWRSKKVVNIFSTFARTYSEWNAVDMKWRQEIQNSTLDAAELTKWVSNWVTPENEGLTNRVPLSSFDKASRPWPVQKENTRAMISPKVSVCYSTQKYPTVLLCHCPYPDHPENYFATPLDGHSMTFSFSRRPISDK